MARCDELGRAPYSDLPDQLFRGWLSPAFAATQARIAEWMRAAGMSVRVDAATNLIGRYDARTSGAPALLIGSHIDSVRNAGRYDGPLGVMLAVECVASLHESGRRLPFAIEVIAFGDEEGSRFPAAMLTSRAVAGTLGDVPDMADGDGTTLLEALARYRSPATRADSGTMADAARAPGDVLAYLEAHIEQGPVLEAEHVAVGTVTGIAAQLRYRLDVTGTAGHAGTTSMPLRRDALTAAAEMVLAAERIARADASDLVATVGMLEVAPGAANVIPGRVTFTLDVRSGDQSRRNRAAETILAEFTAINAARGTELGLERIHDLPASPCDPRLMALLDAATQAAGQPIRRLVSGAGHDTMVMAALCPTAMLFVRCAGGISHNPAEAVDPGDVDIALQIMTGFIDRFGETLA